MRYLLIVLLLFLGCDEDSPTAPNNDCAGVSGGTAFSDDCNQCVGGTTGLLENYLMDECGVCGGDGPVENFDCEGNCLISSDCEGICGGDNTACEDCNGVQNGTAYLDNCNTCDSIPENDCVQDCSGTWGGNATYDLCGTCDDNLSNDCVNDCNGVLGGDAFTDDCGQCVGGTTGLAENYLMDECNVCNGTGIPDGECDCNGNTEDVCGVCGGNGLGCNVDLTIYHPGNNGTYRITLWRSDNFELQTTRDITQDTYEKIEEFIPPGTYYIEFNNDGIIVNWITITFEANKNYIIKTTYGEGQNPNMMDTWLFETNGEYICPTEDLCSCTGFGTDYDWPCEDRVNKILECPVAEPPYCIP